MVNGVADLWTMVLEELKAELSALAIATWFDEVTPVKIDREALYLYCENSFKCSTIERCYTQQIQKGLRRRGLSEMQVLFISKEEYEAQLGRRDGRRKPGRQTSKFTFDSFVVGDSNQLAYNAAQAIAAGFAEYCNPLVIYGNPGLGKTHLLHAIATAASASAPDLEIVSVKGDEFTNELVEAIRANNTARFREKYRRASIFLMDDVQFIAGKKQTQEEFFNTFDALYEDGCSIVITMDRPPWELVRLEERITNRFAGGLTVKIAEPEYETRLEIVKMKAKGRGLQLSQEDLQYIAERVTGSVRQIEGVLNKLKVSADYKVALCVKDVVDSVPSSAKTPGSPEGLIERVCAHFAVDPQLLKGKGGTRNVTLARHVAMYVLCHGLRLSTTKVGEMMERDHSSVCYALQAVEAKMGSDDAFAETVHKLMTM